MNNRETYLSNPTIIQCIKNLLSLGGTSLTIGRETYILNPMQDDIRRAISSSSESTKEKKRPQKTPRSSPSLSPFPSELDMIPAQELNTDDIDTTSTEIPIFQTSVIRSQLEALSLEYGVEYESVIYDIPENRGYPGSQERNEYINTCFHVWGVRSNFVRVADRLTTVLKIAHMSDLYVLYREIEENIKASPSNTSHGRGLTSVVYDGFCTALPDTHRKNAKMMKRDAEKCFVFLMTTGAQKIYDTPSISYESVRRLPASRVKTLLDAILASGKSFKFGDYEALVTIPRKITSVPRPLSDSVIPKSKSDVRKLVNDNRKHLRNRDVESDIDRNCIKRIRRE